MTVRRRVRDQHVDPDRLVREHHAGDVPLESLRCLPAR